MGYSTRPGTSIADFEPDDTDTEMYIASDGVSFTLEELLDKIKAKWPDYKLDEINIEADYIHTHCLYFDRYDSGDYTKYLHVTYKPMTTMEVVRPEEGWTITSFALAMRNYVPDINPMVLRDRMRKNYWIKDEHDTNHPLSVIDVYRICNLYSLRLVERETPQ